MFQTSTGLWLPYWLCLMSYGHLCAHGRQKIMTWSERWNTLQTCPRQNLNPDGWDLCPTALPWRRTEYFGEKACHIYIYIYIYIYSRYPPIHRVPISYCERSHLDIYNFLFRVFSSWPLTSDRFKILPNKYLNIDIAKVCQYKLSTNKQKKTQLVCEGVSGARQYMEYWRRTGRTNQDTVELRYNNWLLNNLYSNYVLHLYLLSADVDDCIKLANLANGQINRQFKTTPFTV